MNRAWPVDEATIVFISAWYHKPDLFFYQTVEELASEFYRDIEVASLVDPERIKRKSTTSLEDSSSSISRDSK